MNEIRYTESENNFKFLRGIDLLKYSNDPIKLKRFLYSKATRIEYERSAIRKSIVVVNGGERSIRSNIHVVLGNEKNLPMINRTGKYSPSMIVPELGGVTMDALEQRFGNDYIDLELAVKDFLQLLGRFLICVQWNKKYKDIKEDYYDALIMKHTSNFSEGHRKRMREDFQSFMSAVFNKVVMLLDSENIEEVIKDDHFKDIVIDIFCGRSCSVTTRGFDDLDLDVEGILISYFKNLLKHGNFEGMKKDVEEKCSKNPPYYVDKIFKLLMDSIESNVHLLQHKKKIAAVKKSSDVQPVVIQGCGDISMNYWNVAYVSTKDEEGKIIHVHGEPLDQREYTCLISWKRDLSSTIKDELRENTLSNKNGQSRNQMFFAGHQNHPNLSIGRVCFSQYETGEKKVKLNSQVGMNIGDKIEYALYGQALVWQGELKEAREIVKECSDIRHVIQTVNINPKIEKKENVSQEKDGEQKKGDEQNESETIYDKYEKCITQIFKQVDDPNEGFPEALKLFFVNGQKQRLIESYLTTPRYIFGKATETAVWLGEYALLHNKELLQSACDHPIEIALSDLGAPLEWITVCMVISGCRLKKHRTEVVDRCDFCWDVTDPTDPKLVWFPGVAIYPCTMVGIGQLQNKSETDGQDGEDTSGTFNGDLFLLAWGHAFNEDQSYSIFECATFLRDLGAQAVLLIDEGQDVYQHFFNDHGELRKFVRGESSRESYLVAPSPQRCRIRGSLAFWGERF